ncbi:MAG: tRNA (adenine(22)-N(1))-methyltransferase TrmK [Pseudomonadota bacterium]
MVPGLRPVVDVGCDHGFVARALGAIGTERRAHRLPAHRAVPMVVADGLTCFSHVGVAIIAGMGAAAIARILSLGPRPQVAVLHAPDRPAWLRFWCAGHGWRIDAEGLAPEAGRFAEVIRVVPGEEPHTGLALAFGPLLVDDPLADAHAAQLSAWWRGIAAQVRGRDPAKLAEAEAWIAFLGDLRARIAARRGGAAG